jgi:putative methionine-R-sulfoxide reductase with GAF domain
LALGDVGYECVRDHNGDLDVGVFERFENVWIGIVDFDSLGFERFDKLH